MKEDQRPYYEAFYGAMLPAHLRSRIEKPFTAMIKQLLADIKEEYPGVEGDALKKLVLVGLRGLRRHGVKHPNGYFSCDSEVAHAFQDIQKSHKNLADRDKAVEQSRAYSEEATIADNTRETFLQFIAETTEVHIEAGVEPQRAIIKAFIDLLEATPEPGGYEYYLLQRSIPHKLGIIGDAEVRKAFDAHPAFEDTNSKDTHMNLGDLSEKEWEVLAPVFAAIQASDLRKEVEAATAKETKNE